MSREYRKRALGPSPRSRRGCGSPRRPCTCTRRRPGEDDRERDRRRAGVQRATVYRHFPDERGADRACSAHWMIAQPAARLGAWAAIAGPRRRGSGRAGRGLGWYERTETMVERLLRDRARPCRAIAERLRRPRRVLRRPPPTSLHAAGGCEARRRPRVRAAIGHALEFETWPSLVRRSGPRARRGGRRCMAAPAAKRRGAPRSPPVGGHLDPEAARGDEQADRRSRATSDQRSLVNPLPVVAGSKQAGERVDQVGDREDVGDVLDPVAAPR